MKLKTLVLTIFIMSILMLNSSSAADIEYDSFAEAEAAAHTRAEEYNKKMKEHMEQLNDKWEKQQKELGSDGATPDVTKITETSDGNKSSANDAQEKMTGAVDDSVNDLKDQMINSAGANTTGFAGGGAGYQWKVKIVNGKYVLSDSYNEADFITGDKKDEPEGEAEGGDAVADAKAAEVKPEETAEPEPEPDVVVTKPAVTAPSDSSSSDPSSGSSSPAASDPSAPASSSPAATPSAAEPASPSGTSGSPSSTKVATVPAKPGINVAPTKLPPPAVRLTIENPIDFTEEVFSTNTTNTTAKNYKLKKFSIPEDTRVKMAMELAPGLDPDKITMVLTDEEGQSAPVTATKMRNYRHMFRVPSDKKYHATVYYKDDVNGGGQAKKLMEVNIPVTKVDFDARAMASSKRSGGTSNQNVSDESSTGNYTSGYKHSNFGGSEQVDLSDAYDDPSAGYDSNGASSEDNDGNQIGQSSQDNQGSSSNTTTGTDETNGSGGNGGSIADASDYGYSDNGDASSNSSSAANGDGDANGTYDNSSASNGNSNGSNTGNSGANSSYGNSGSSGNNSSNSNYNDSVNNNGSNSDGNGSNMSGSSDSSENPSTDEYALASGNNSNNGSSGNSGNGNYGNGQSDYSGSGSSSDANGNSNADYDNNGGMDNGSGEGYANEGAANYSSSSGQISDATYDSEGMKKSSDQNKKTDGEYVDGEAKELEGEFVVGLSIQAPSLKIYQSFDFIDDTSPTSATIPPKTEMGIGLSFGANVDPSTVQVSVRDGTNSVSGSLDKVGESFVHVLSGNTANVTINISGVAGKSKFSYSLNVPVS